MDPFIAIYSDGSCDPLKKVGGWAAIIFQKNKKTIINGYAPGTTNQRMELTAIIRSLEAIQTDDLSGVQIKIYSDSQYAIKLPARKDKLKAGSFLTKRGVPVRNADLLAVLIKYIESMNIEFIKVKAHQKTASSPDFSREADMLSRKIMRKHLLSLGSE